MKLLLVRHAVAVPRGTPGIPDEERPLTKDGKADFRVAARGLVRIVQRPDVLLTSPLPRARVTAQIAARAFNLIEPRSEPALARGSVDAIVAALKAHAPGATVALVGHEPVLGELLARLLGASPDDARLAFQKGGAALVDLPDGPSSAGCLIWFLEPRILRTLAGAAEVPADAPIRTLAIDFGGTHLKASVVDGGGHLLTEPVRIDTPVGSSPRSIVGTLATLVAPLGAYDRVSIGFPGVVRAGRILTAPNLGNDGWTGFDLDAALTKALGKPVRIANDADVQGLAVVAGKGVEMILTLGTGFGTGLYVDGRLAPHLELAHHPFRKGETYEAQLGNAARKRVGNKKWNKRVKKAIEALRALTTFDHLYVGGGNAKKIDFEPDPDVTIVGNEAGIEGGVALWRS